MTLPRGLKPMLAVAGPPFDSERHRFEVKWDGIRALAYLDRGAFWLESRSLAPLLPRFPELETAKESVRARAAVLDGEIIVPGPGGEPDFDRARRRIALSDPRAIAGASRREPAVYIAFDALHLDGEDLFDTPLRARLERLAAAVEPSERLLLARGVTGSGIAFFEAVKARGLEGMVAKELDSPYRPGARSRHWIKVRNVREADCVVGGFVPKGRLGVKSLVLGLYDAAGHLRCVGHAGSGFTERENRLARQALERMVTAKCPFAEPPQDAAGEAVWVEPRLVCTVEYLALTGTGRLRHPAFRGFRSDKEPEACRLEHELARDPGWPRPRTGPGSAGARSS